MGFKPLPETTGDWELTFLRCALVAGFTLLPVQVWARLALSGLIRQDIEEILGPFAFLLGLLLLGCSVVALLKRQRLLGLMLAVVAIISVLVALLPNLLNEAIIN